MTGSHELNGDRPTFRQMAGTMMACPQSMDSESAFVEVLRMASTFKIAKHQLELFDATGKLVARFEAQMKRP